MAFHWCDNNLHTTVFTPRDFQVELLAAAYERNTIICLGHRSSKEFIALKLLQELSRRGRQRGRVSVYLSCEVGVSKEPCSIYTMLTHLTDLRVWQEQPDMQIPFTHCWTDYHVSILRPEGFLSLLQGRDLLLSSVELIVLEDCHDSAVYQRIMPIFEEHIIPAAPADRPRILGLAGPLHSAGCELQQLSAMLATLERNVLCRIETASDIVTVLRYCSRPHEYIVQCAPFEMDELSLMLADVLNTHKSFLVDHRYDPYEIYGTDQFMEELKDIPDPKVDPLNVINSLLAVLHEMGPWCTQRAAQHFYHCNEKLKVKTPHERHYLLYCLVSTALIQLHSLCDNAFLRHQGPGGDSRQTIERYSSPKVRRLLQTLRCFKPEDVHTQADGLRRMRQQVDQADFNRLSHALENKCRVVDQLEQQPTETRALVANLEQILHTSEDKQPAVRSAARLAPSPAPSKNKPGSGSNNGQQRTRRRVYTRRHHRDQHDGSDTLCALIYCNQNHTARVLFELLAEVSRRDPDLKFLRCQYTTDRVADPTTEPKEAELEHRRQEEVLKRFRMHDCNVLIGTSVLEEGIDVPKCNLVVRWDPPTTYRSYVQCKGRARAAPAYHVILVAPSYESPPVGPVRLSDRSHRFICGASGTGDTTEGESDSDDSAMPNSCGSDPYTFGTARGTVKILNPEVFSKQPPTACDIKLQEIQDESPALGFLDNSNSSDEAVSMSNTSPSESSTERKSRRFQCELGVPTEPEATTDPSPKIETVDRLSNTTKKLVHQMAQYREIEQMLLSKCANTEPPEQEQSEAERFSACLAAYRPKPHLLTGASVDLGTAIALVNKYCARLPSDTFTKLTALWRCTRSQRDGVTLFQYTLRLPINSPLKHDIVGLPMPTQTLARRLAALQACVELHRIGELDDQLQPIGKEGFRALEPDWECFDLEPEDEQIVQLSDEPRPGTTKRRQYYYKRIASEFCDCRPVAGSPCYLYFIQLTLQCPIPEEQNTRGRKIYPPEDAQQGFGILTSKRIPKLSAFSIFTRSGEVKVSLELAKERVVLTSEQIVCINGFLNYTFTNVLRLQKFLMLFDPDSTENCVFIVPTVKAPAGGKHIDWQFLELIQANGNTMPRPVPDEERQAQAFDAQRFQDAVVMPWYRNQDQPQYFYVAEICPHLSPLSCFPGDNYRTFKHYYLVKYGLTIQNASQPLLDVDHTSARLNFLTPRYVNRKGVALPTSSEETKRAKRENLEQKQILVPELCTVHPFPASLWRTAVCLPCILYRINGLLLADDIRKQVSADLGLGRQQIEEDDFEWPMLDFGWSLSEVLKKSRESKQKDSQKEALVNGNDLGDVQKEPVKEETPPDEDSKADNAEKSAVELIIEGEQKLQEADDFIEIGTWSNDMADDIATFNQEDEDEDEAYHLPVLPANVKFCDQQTRYGSPTFWDVSNGEAGFKAPKRGQNQQGNKGKGKGPAKPAFNYYDSDNSLGSSYDDDDNAGPLNYMHHNYSSDDDDVADDIDAGRIAFTSKNEAETIETAQEVEKRQKQLSIIQATNANERQYQQTKNLLIGFNFEQEEEDQDGHPSGRYEQSIAKLKTEIESCGMLVPHDQQLVLKRSDVAAAQVAKKSMIELLKQLLPYVTEELLAEKLGDRRELLLSDLVELNADWVSRHEQETYTVLGCGDSFDNYNDHHRLNLDKKQLRLQFDRAEIQPTTPKKPISSSILPAAFSFDRQPNLVGHPGPSPSIILQALTMSNANDGINLERLETIGDSFLKYAITTYLYITYENVHEGKLSHLRSKQVANLNLYRLGRRKRLGEYMIATKFEPHDNWLPPCYYVPKELEKALIEAKIPTHHWKLADLLDIKNLSSVQICEMVREKAEALGLGHNGSVPTGQIDDSNDSCNDFSCFIPYNLVSQHSIPDKSIADCVEALIGAYLIECGPRGALLFMAWLGVRVLPFTKQLEAANKVERIPGSTRPNAEKMVTVYGAWPTPRSPLLHFAPNATEELDQLLSGFEEFEESLGYQFRDRSYLLQAMTHASYTPNRLTDCYQRLEFLGDAVLDYLITRHLYEDPRQHSPGALTDLRSALVNNTIFASLAVRHGFHKFFRHLSPGLNDVIDRFVRIQQENGHSISEEYYLLSEEECDDAEDVEVPKALGDVFESIAGAIFLDSNMSLDVVWHVYSNMMSPEIEQFSNSVPKSPIRELLELEPETAKFGKPEKLADGRRVRVTVDVFCKGTFRGIGRNYRIAKCTAAKCALRQLKKQGLIAKKD
ncbi:endoribonuclease Dcr-1 [Drosophila subpulchrella]|uniref:endoribonuclease Dcr-1 n=1 Tax=Drosophila subpulchrella TaxID=1486046 RepID=UPI0018A18C12|nr:endoribonuclease Dcr-1 [Drosophila subpulchrella]